MDEVKWYENTPLDTIKSIIKDNVNNASRAFIKIGYYLKDVRNRELFSADGYENIWEFAHSEFGISKSSASRFMAINDKFSFGGNSPELLDQYKDFSCSKLQEMLTLTAEELEQISLTTTVAEIRAMKNTDKVVATSQQQEFVLCDDKKPEVGTIIFGVGGNGEISKYEVNSKDCSFSEKYFTVKDKLGFIHSLSVESEHWHYSRDDAKKDSWYREKQIKPTLDKVVTDTLDSVVNEVETVVDVVEKTENGIEEIENSLPCDTCGWDVQGCCNFDSSEGDYCVKGDKWTSSVETVEAEVIHTEEDPEKYSLSDVEWEIRTHTNSLEVLRQDSTISPVRYKTKMRLDAATTLLDKIKEPVIDIEPDQEVVQPEFIILKNNDQRKDFIDNYTSWPVWIDQILTGERYYRYDLMDKVSIVVKVSRKHAWKSYKETKDYEYGAEQYYLIGVKSDWSQKGTKFTIDDSRTFYECNTNKSALVEYLKEFQKKG